MNIDYILAIDGGGTKTLAKLVNLYSAEEFTAQAGAASVYNDFNTALTSLQQVITSVCAQSGAKHSQILAVMGLAGGSSKVLAERVTASLQLDCDIKFAQLSIVSDAITSLYGANLGQPVAMLALGTGAVAARLSADGETKLIGGWGFSVDDFGGGARLGLSAVQCLLDEIDRFEQPKSLLTQQLSEQVGREREQISSWLMKAKALDYARFSPLIFSLKTQCIIADTVLSEHVRQVERLIEKCRGQSQLPVIIIGGLADVTIALLNENTQLNLSPRQGDSLAGAVILASDRIKQIEYTRITQ
ncbi:BadF/BadG/BcrA/BcrD ATPase family protein [Pseudoalteromonas sp. SG44-17]|uniref:BadF/BadG/BcrA/BcrD ATPase family protein n=1 Tax=Pseudoalteromonas sp. SG44-17 TaxID=2760963 RepID=UPI0016028F1C|nr:BadF/BadG/BcrA/BcrD ATPase family protein [Pseudoalteromonas sp. SG44-17]MBB1408142.1 ATPase [Pseudoalteromonas sp. SG44-17]